VTFLPLTVNPYTGFQTCCKQCFCLKQRLLHAHVLVNKKTSTTKSGRTPGWTTASMFLLVSKRRTFAVSFISVKVQVTKGKTVSSKSWKSKNNNAQYKRAQIVMIKCFFFARMCMIEFIWKMQRISLIIIDWFRHTKLCLIDNVTNCNWHQYSSTHKYVSFFKPAITLTQNANILTQRSLCGFMSRYKYYFIVPLQSKWIPFCTFVISLNVLNDYNLIAYALYDKKCLLKMHDVKLYITNLT